MKQYQRPFIYLMTWLLLWSQGTAAEVSQDVIAATQPLHRTIDTLREKLDSMEARHETLEAATEQFRLKVKSLNEKLSEEKSRYDWLTQAKSDQEKKDKEQIEKLKSRIDEILKAKVTMEKEYETKLIEESIKHEKAMSTAKKAYETVLTSEKKAYETKVIDESTKHESAMNNAKKAYEAVLASEKKAYETILQNERNKHLEYEIEIAKKAKEIETQKDQIKVLMDEQDQLQTSLRTQGLDLSSVMSENEQLREELLRTQNEVQHRDNIVRNLENELELARWRPPSWKDIAESDTVSATIDVLFEYWEWLKDDVVPHSLERLSVVIKTIGHSAMIFVEEGTAHFKGGRAAFVTCLKEQPDGTRGTLLQVTSNFLMGAIDDAWLRTVSFAARIWEENFVPILVPYLSNTPIKCIIRVVSKLTEIHNAMASTLEWIAITISSFYATNLGGSHGHWLYTTCMCTKDHSHRIILLLEVALGLLALDVSLTSLRRSRKRFGGGRRISKHHHHSSVLHPKGPPPSASLLRTAGGLSLRHP